MDLLKSYIRKYKKQCILSPLFKLLEACFELIVPLVVKGIIDTGIPNSDKSYIIGSVVILVIFAVAGVCFAITAQYFASYAAAGISTDLRSDLFDKVTRLQEKDYDKLGSSSLITSLTSDVNQIASGINMVLRLLLRSPLIVIGATIMAFTVSVKLALIFIAVDLILFAVVYLNMKRSVPSFRKTREGLDEMVDVTSNGISGVRVIRGFNRTLDIESGFVSKSGVLNSDQKKAAAISAILSPVTYLVINLAVCLLIGLGALDFKTGALTAGAVTALYNYMSQILVELIKGANVIVLLNKATACLDRVRKIMAIDTETKKDTVELTDKDHAHEIRFEDVTFSYPGSSEPAVENISFDVKASSTLGIIGMTGSGKSTIAKLIAGLYEPDSGLVSIDGVSITDVDKDCLSKELAMSLQKTSMFTASIRDNITLSRPGITDEDCIKACDISMTQEIIAGKDEGLDTIVHASGAGLSGGQKQRIGIARTLAGKPGVVILDDSTSALDSITERKVINNLFEMEDRPTVILISQKIRTVKRCDKILFIEDGKALYCLPHNELYEQSESYRRLCSLQREAV